MRVPSTGSQKLEPETTALAAAKSMQPQQRSDSYHSSSKIVITPDPGAGSLPETDRTFSPPVGY